MGSSWRFFGCAVGFAFGVVWMTVGLGSAIVCLLVAALGYGAVFMAERAQANRPPNQTSDREDAPPATDEFGLDHGDYDELPDAATNPLAAEAEYGWPWPAEDHAEEAEQVHAQVPGERT